MPMGWFKKQDGDALPPPRADAGAASEGDEWSFLRAQPDHDADEMAHVRQSGSHVAALSAPPRDAPPAELIPGFRPVPGRTRPIRAREAPAAEPAIRDAGALVLEMNVAGYRTVRTVEGDSLLGRTDLDRNDAPDLEFDRDDAVSRRHARISVRHGRFLLQDLNSTNGTWLNGRKLSSGSDVPLQPGDEVEIGDRSVIRVLAVGADNRVLSAEDRMLGQMVHAATGTDGPADRETAAAAAAAPAEDMLDKALHWGETAGLMRMADASSDDGSEPPSGSLVEG